LVTKVESTNSSAKMRSSKFLIVTFFSSTQFRSFRRPSIPPTSEVYRENSALSKRCSFLWLFATWHKSPCAILTNVGFLASLIACNPCLSLISITPLASWILSRGIGQELIESLNFSNRISAFLTSLH